MEYKLPPHPAITSLYAKYTILLSNSSVRIASALKSCVGTVFFPTDNTSIP